MKLLKNTIIYSAVTILKSGIGVFLLPLYSAYLTTEDYGIWGIVTSVAQLLGLIMLLSLNGAGMRYHYELKETPGAQRRLWGTIYSTVFLNALTAAVIATVAHKLLIDTWTGGIPFFPFVFIGVGAAFFQSGYQICLTFFKASQEGKRAGSLEAAYFLFNLLLTVVFLVIFDLKVIGVLLALLAANGVFGAVSFFMFRPHITLGFDKPLLKRSLKYALPLIPHAAAGWIMTLIDRLFLNSMVSTSEAGVYTVGFQIANVLHVFMVALNQAYSPWFYEQTTEGEAGKKRVAHFSELFVLFFAVMGLFLSLFTPEALRLFATAAYHPGWVVTPFLAFAFVCRSIYYMVVGPVFLNKVSLVPIVTFTGALLNVVLNALLIGPYGKIGASAASLMTMLVTSLMALYMSRKVGTFTYRWVRMYAYTFVGFALSLLVFLDEPLGPLYTFFIKSAAMLLVIAVLFARYKKDIGQFYSTFLKKGPKQ